MQTAIPMAPPKNQTPASGTPSASSSGEGALFDFDDLQALRDEYEERIAKLEREKTAALDVSKRDNDSRFATMQRDYESRLQNEATSRQELIHELTFELAAAREDGERRAQEADKRRLVVEQQLEGALAEVSRIEADVQRLKATLVRAMEGRASSQPPTPAAASPPAANTAAKTAAPVAASQVLSSQPAVTPPPVPREETLSAAVAAFAPGKKKKIRLR